jgi:hypothetical protein
MPEDVRPLIHRLVHFLHPDAKYELPRAGRTSIRSVPKDAKKWGGEASEDTVVNA